MLKIINQILMFVIELIMIGSFAFVGFAKGNSTVAKYALAITIPVIAIALWGYWAAPKSTHRLGMPYLALFRGTMFLVASYLLYISGQTEFSIVLAVLSIMTQIVSYFTERENRD